MSENQTKEKHISVRVKNEKYLQLSTYAHTHNLTFSKAVEILLEQGLKSELQQTPNTSKDEQSEVVSALIHQLEQKDIQLREKDKQLEQLGDSVKILSQALHDAQIVAGQAQTLHYEQQLLDQKRNEREPRRFLSRFFSK